MTSNRLGDAASAYLRSASHQPIHWYPWGDEAFAAARTQDRPVLLDIGAVWCHWCHVMDGESYEDPAIARYLNENFICIKVDRDERPDVDARYQRAVQAFTRQGGWPLTAFLTPDGDVFYGGTYFPPEGKYGQPGFRTVLASVLDAYRSRRGQVQAQAQAIRKVLDTHLDESAPGEPSPALLSEAEERIAQVFDPVNGGFGSQPKFPHPGAVTFLLHRWHDRGDERTREIIDRTLQGMARGGMHDQLGGGFHRYSVDAKWIVPHFEKMSYDNSELLKAYLDAYAAFGTEEYAEVARGIVRWVREVASDSAGGYAASQDADVGLDDDGDYFTWTRDEAAQVLSGDELEVAAAYYDIGTAGEMHHNPGKNVLFVAAPLAAVARLTGLTEEAATLLLASAKRKLLEARNRRPTPFVDRTRYASWNAMMASAMLRAGAVLGDGEARRHALATLELLQRESPEPDALPHTPGGVTGLLDDQVQGAAAALDAYEATGDRAWLAWAERLMERVWRDYWDEASGGLFDTARDRGGEQGLLPTRVKPVQDTPTPSPNGVAGITLMRLHELTADARWRERAGALVSAFAGGALELGLHGSAFLLALDWYLEPGTHLVVIGEEGDAAADAMHRAALAGFAPRRVVQRLAPADADPSRLPPALAGMLTVGSGTRGYACVGTSCSLPATTLEEWEQRLAWTKGQRQEATSA
ncbi:MAG TPA: thioredoxin domain-containing protein [Gemmatimonadales bacterium]|nr:thioredoxin domain-containing protein [Gemmatimonadales bacterium]